MGVCLGYKTKTSTWLNIVNNDKDQHNKEI